MNCVADIGLKSQILSESAAFGGREGQVSAMSTIDKGWRGRLERLWRFEESRRLEFQQECNEIILFSFDGIYVP